jgi:hypothetical protein
LTRNVELAAVEVRVEEEDRVELSPSSARGSSARKPAAVEVRVEEEDRVELSPSSARGSSARKPAAVTATSSSSALSFDAIEQRPTAKRVRAALWIRLRILDRLAAARLAYARHPFDISDRLASDRWPGHGEISALPRHGAKRNGEQLVIASHISINPKRTKASAAFRLAACAL